MNTISIKLRLLGYIFAFLGAAGYMLTGAASLTAMIPILFGLVFILLGRLAKSESWRMSAAHTAVILAFVGAVGTFSGIPDFLSWLMGNQEVNGMAAAVRSIMALVCIGFVATSLKSFLDARSSREV